MGARKSVSRIVLLTVVLTAAWYVLSGRLDLLYFGTGAVSALVIALIARPPVDPTVPRIGRLLLFLPWLFSQVVRSNLRIVRIVLSPRMPIQPMMIRRPPGVSGARALTLLGMSTTLTPGTLTVDVGEDAILVHALDRQSVADVKAGVMARRVARVFDRGDA
jgi:multicomponent Na+:H+ antiporter subunit E